MNRLGQFGLILLILSIGELVQKYFKLIIPATVIGMIILLLSLLLKIFKLSWVEGISQILLDNMSILFVPAGVALMKEYGLFKDHILQIVFIIFITSILVMVSTGYTVQLLISLREGRKKI